MSKKENRKGYQKIKEEEWIEMVDMSEQKSNNDFPQKRERQVDNNVVENNKMNYPSLDVQPDRNLKEKNFNKKQEIPARGQQKKPKKPSIPMLLPVSFVQCLNMFQAMLKYIVVDLVKILINVNHFMEFLYVDAVKLRYALDSVQAQWQNAQNVKALIKSLLNRLKITNLFPNLLHSHKKDKNNALDKSSLLKNRNFSSILEYNDLCIDFSKNDYFNSMSGQGQDQQLSFKYLFIITPLEIKSNSKLKSSSSKAVLIKLGNKTAKCTEMNVPLELQIDVLYSKTLQKYCPIKGIIKIYDVSQDGSEIISCVGGFQTDQLLNQGKTKVTIEKELGTSKLKMDISILNKSDKKGQIGFTRQNSKNQLNSSRDKIIPAKAIQVERPNQSNFNWSSASSPRMQGNISQAGVTSQGRKNSLLSAQNTGVKGIQIPFKNTSSNINKSIQKINQALNFKRFEDNNVSNRATQVLNKAEIQNLKQQLSEEKRKSLQLQQRYNKTNTKLNGTKIALQNLNGQIKSHIQIFKKIIADLQVNKLDLKINELEKTLSIKYKSKFIEKSFKEFVETMVKKVNQFVPLSQNYFEGIEKDRSAYQLQQAKKQVAILKKLTMQKDKKIYTLQKQLEGVEVTIHNLKQTNKHLSQQNNYLREKNDQIQLNLYHKQNSLETLRKEIQKYSFECQDLENKLYNAGLQLQELKQQLSDCNETIERYQKKYGQMKDGKNRALQMEIKECIRWIDQQDRQLEMSEMEQTMQSQHKDEKDDSLSSVIRNIQKVLILQNSITKNDRSTFLECGMMHNFSYKNIKLRYIINIRHKSIMKQKH